MSRTSKLLVAGLLALAACRKSAPAGPLRQVNKTFNIQSLQMPDLQRVDWAFDFYFLGDNPPSMYHHYPVSSSEQAGLITGVLPCLTGPDGTGLNQVIASATLYFAGQTVPLKGSGARTFTCVQNDDVALNLTISIDIVTDPTVGWVDPNGQVTVINCAPRTDWKGDSWLAVCSDSSCGDTDSVFLFENACSQLGGGIPAIWTCGAPSDWSIIDLPTPLPATVTATSQFAVPPGDGNWQFGISALPQVTLSAPDPALTDAAGHLVVFSNVETPIATLKRSGGVNSSTLDSTRTAAFAADLVLAADTPGGSTPHQLLELRIGGAGSQATVWEPFGACDSPVQGTQSWTGLFPIDVTLLDPATARITLSATPGGVATQRATCSAVRANDGTPQILCTAAGPLS